MVDCCINVHVDLAGGGGGGNSNIRMLGCVCLVSDNRPILNDTLS